MTRDASTSGPTAPTATVDAPEDGDTTRSGIPVRPFYTPEDSPVRDGDGYRRELGDPGVFPFTRGLYPDMYRQRLWTMRQYAGYSSAAESNEISRHRALDALGECCQVTSIGAATTAQQLQAEVAPQLRQLISQLGGIARIELCRIVQFRVTLARRIGPQTPKTGQPAFARVGRAAQSG